jgi:hypothetical protein
MLPKVGRHIRPAVHFKSCVAREGGESPFPAGYQKQFPSLRMFGHQGPFALLGGALGPPDIALVARILGRCSRGRDADQVVVEYRDLERELTAIRVTPMDPDQMTRDWLL